MEELLCVVFFILGVLSTICVMLLYKKYKPHTEEFAYYNIDFEKIRTEFDNLINNEIDTYFKLHPDLLQAGESYLKREDIQNIIAEITTKCVSVITKPIRSNLKYVYNFDTDEDLIKIIGAKVGLVIAGMAARINSSMLDDSVNIF